MNLYIDWIPRVDLMNKTVGNVFGFLFGLKCSYTTRHTSITMQIKVQLTPNFNLLPVHSRLLVHYVCTNFRTEYFI